MTNTLRDKLAFAMYLVDFEAEHIPGNPQDLCILATRWGLFRASSDSDVSYIAESYYTLADRMIAHWDQHTSLVDLTRCFDARRQHERDAGVGSEQ